MYKSQRTPNPLLRLLLLSGLTFDELKLRLNALFGLSGLRDDDQKLPLLPWLLKPPFQFPEKTPRQPRAPDAAH